MLIWQYVCSSKLISEPQADLMISMRQKMLLKFSFVPNNKPETEESGNLTLLNGLLYSAQCHCNCSVVNLRYSAFVPSMDMLISFPNIIIPHV